MRPRPRPPTGESPARAAARSPDRPDRSAGEAVSELSRGNLSPLGTPSPTSQVYFKVLSWTPQSVTAPWSPSNSHSLSNLVYLLVITSSQPVPQTKSMLPATPLSRPQRSPVKPRRLGGARAAENQPDQSAGARGTERGNPPGAPGGDRATTPCRCARAWSREEEPAVLGAQRSTPSGAQSWRRSLPCGFWGEGFGNWSSPSAPARAPTCSLGAGVGGILWVTLRTESAT